MVVFRKGCCTCGYVADSLLIVLGVSSIFVQVVVGLEKDISKISRSPRQTIDYADLEDDGVEDYIINLDRAIENDKKTVSKSDENDEDVPVSSSSSSSQSPSSTTTTTTAPWIDLDMKLPALEEGSEPERISELNLELKFEDGTPSTTMTILDPNITWSSGEEHQIISIQNPDMAPVPIEKDSGSEDHPTNVTESQTNATNPPTNATNPQINATNPQTNVTDYDEGNGPIEEEHEMSAIHQPVVTPVPIDSDEKKVEPEVIPEAIVQKESLNSKGNIPACSCQHLESIVEELKIKSMGQKGDADIVEVPKVISIVGAKGEPGPPGYCSKSCENGDGSFLYPTPSPASIRRQPNTERKPEVPLEGLYKIVPGALVFPTRSAMLQMKEFSFVGTVAYVETDQTFYGRVQMGWRSFSMGRVHRTFAATIPRSSKPLKDQVKCSSTSLSGSGACVDVTLGNFKRQEPVALKRAESSNFQGDNPMNQESGRRAHVSETKTRKSLDSGLILDARAINPVRLIALNSPMTGKMGGIQQINYQCQRQALKNSVHGIFRAFLSYTETFRNSEAMITNLNNETVFSSLNKWVIKNDQEMTKANPPIFAFNGKIVFDKNERSAKIWGDFNTNSGQQGTGSKDCQNWGSNDPGDTGTVTNPFEMSGNRRRLEKCDKKLTVLCIEVMHLSQVNLRHRNSNKIRLSFDKYLAILEAYDYSLRSS